MKLTVRLSKPTIGITDLLKKDHKLSGPIVDWGGIKGCEVYYGTVFNGAPGWQDLINSGNKSVAPIDVSVAGAAALIFIPVSNCYMLYSFGNANTKIAHKFFERDFGLKVVLNTVDPAKVRSIDSKILGNVVMNRRTQLSKEKRIEDFGFEINKDFLKHLAGKSSSKTFATVLAGSDSLNIHTEFDIKNAEIKTKEIYNFFHSKTYKTDYSWVDNIRNEKDPTTIDKLNIKLAAAFTERLNGKSNELYVAIPSIIDYDNVDHFRVRGYGSTESFAFVDIENLCSDIVLKKTSITISDLLHYQIEAVAEDNKAIVTWDLFEWLIFEASERNKQYILNEGEWFCVSKGYFNDIQSRCQQIISDPLEFTEIGSTLHKNEQKYLDAYPENRSVERILDRKMVYIYGGNNRVEICDIYESSRTFIHVKEGSSSHNLSHLFNQGYVSASLFLLDNEFRKEIVKRLHDAPKLIPSISNNPQPAKYTIAYRVMRSGKKFRLPFFSQITMLETHRKIKAAGYKFRLEWLQIK